MATTRGQFLIGKVIGSCIIKKLLGQGGSSAVFLAQQSAPRRKVAIKVFLPRAHMQTQMQRQFYSRFLLEAEAASRLDHPHILPIYSYGEQDGLPYIIMPYMPGGTLRDFIAEHGPLSVNQAQWYLAQIAAALDYAHQAHGYVHCDVKPANILMDSDGSAVLADFGIAHLMQPDALSPMGNSSLRSPEMLLGTPDYISPEQALGRRLDGRSDIYSLGITLFYLLTARLPFKADSTIAVALLQVYEPPPTLSQLRADISPLAASVMQKALAKQPDERYQTAGEFSAAFTAAIEDTGMVHEVDLSGKPPMRQGKRVKDLNSKRQRALVSTRPFVLFKPAVQGRFSLARILMTVIPLLIVTVGAALGGGSLVTHIAHVARTNGRMIVSPGIVGDELADNEDWPAGGTFFFAGNLYHIQNRLAHNVALAFYANHQYTNFRLTVSAAELQGSGDGADYYGVVFRGSVDQSRYYLFEVVAWGGGQYQFSRYDGDGHWDIIAGGPAPALLTEAGKSNTITVQARGNVFSFWLNGARIRTRISDTARAALSAGEVGLLVEEQGTEIVFSHLYVSVLA